MLSFLSQKEYTGTTITFLVVLVLALFFFDKYLLPMDDGVYVYVADQIIKGKIFGVEVMDIHGGYKAFFDAWLMSLFGRDIVTISYPLIIITALQSAMFTYMLKNKGMLISVSFGITAAFLGFFFLPSSSPNLYTLFFAVSIVFVLDNFTSSKGRSLAIGLILGLCFMFRHPSAVFLSFGLITYLLYANTHLPAKSKNFLKTSKFVSIIILLSLLLYLFWIADLFTSLVLGVWPIFFLFSLIINSTGITKEFIRNCSFIFVGFIVSLVPMIVYQIVVGDVYLWISNSFLGATGVVNLDAFDNIKYWSLLSHSFVNLITAFSSMSMAAVFYFLSIFLMPIYLGCMVIKRAVLNEQIAVGAIVALFYSYVSIYYQHIGYFFFSLPLTMFAILQMTNVSNNIIKPLLASLCLFILLFTWYISLVSPNNLSSFVDSNLPGVSLRILPEQELLYSELLSTITPHLTDQNSLYVFPMDPQVYFLTEHTAPNKYYGSLFGTSKDNDLSSIKNIISSGSIEVVVFNNEHLYISDHDKNLLKWLENESNFTQIKIVGPFEIYVKE